MGGLKLHQRRAARCSFIALREAAVVDFWRVAAAGKTFLQEKSKRLTLAIFQAWEADLQRPPLK